MSLPGWNPSTLKLYEGPTGLLCSDCCHEVCEETDCYANTPYQVSIHYEVTNNDCGDGDALYWGYDGYDGAKIYSNIDFETELNGTAKILTQDDTFECWWVLDIDVDYDIWVIGWEVADPGCGGCCAGWDHYDVSKIKLRWRRSGSTILSEIWLQISWPWGLVDICSGSGTVISGHCAKIDSNTPITMALGSGSASICSGISYGE